LIFGKNAENILAKRKKLRKTLKRLRNQKAQTEKIVFEKSDFFTPLSKQKNSKTENRQKTDKNLNDSLSANSSRSWQNYLMQKGTSPNIAVRQDYCPGGAKYFSWAWW
jgi:DNA repair ATPase RecN